MSGAFEYQPWDLNKDDPEFSTQECEPDLGDVPAGERYVAPVEICNALSGVNNEIYILILGHVLVANRGVSVREITDRVNSTVLQTSSRTPVTQAYIRQMIKGAPRGMFHSDDEDDCTRYSPDTLAYYAGSLGGNLAMISIDAKHPLHELLSEGRALPNDDSPTLNRVAFYAELLRQYRIHGPVIPVPAIYSEKTSDNLRKFRINQINRLAEAKIGRGFKKGRARYYEMSDDDVKLIERIVNAFGEAFVCDPHAHEVGLKNLQIVTTTREHHAFLMNNARETSKKLQDFDHDAFDMQLHRILLDGPVLEKVLAERLGISTGALHMRMKRGRLDSNPLYIKTKDGRNNVWDIRGRAVIRTE